MEEEKIKSVNVSFENLVTEMIEEKNQNPVCKDGNLGYQLMDDNKNEKFFRYMCVGVLTLLFVKFAIVCTSLFVDSRLEKQSVPINNVVQNNVEGKMEKTKEKVIKFKNIDGNDYQINIVLNSIKGNHDDKVKVLKEGEVVKIDYLINSDRNELSNLIAGELKSIIEINPSITEKEIDLIAQKLLELKNF